ncbi:MAG: hypothetical protein AAF798_18075 [Bacteroidota bacterium]
MARTGKMTAFGRLFIALLILVPAAYFGASYLNGEDGVANLKQMINGEETTTTTVVLEENNCEDRILELTEEKEQLEELLKAKDRELEALREQLQD